VKDAEQYIVPFAGGDHCVRFFGIHRHNFVCDDVLACIHRFDGEFRMGIVWGG